MHLLKDGKGTVHTCTESERAVTRDGKWICTQDGLKLVEKEFTAPRTPGCGAPLLPTYPRTHVCLLKARAQGVRSSEAGSEVQGEEA